jgi:hypothetical protein
MPTPPESGADKVERIAHELYPSFLDARIALMQLRDEIKTAFERDGLEYNDEADTPSDIEESFEGPLMPSGMETWEAINHAAQIRKERA